MESEVIVAESRPAPSRRDLPARRQSLGEEIANAVTHGVGAALGITALVVLVVASRGDAWRVVSLSVYGGSLVLLFTISTLYHSLPGPRAKRVFRILDHSAIYVLIAGTYTPVSLVSLRGGWGWTLFGLIWGLAAAGIVVKSVAIHRFRILSAVVYVAMGWLVVIAAKPVLTHVPRALIGWLLAGGVCYTVGTVFFAWKRMRYHHMIWHLFVLAGSACHFFGLLFHLAAAE